MDASLTGIRQAARHYCARVAMTVLLAVPGIVAAAEPETLCTDQLGNRSVRFVVGQRPGGGFDQYTRLIASLYSERTGAGTRVINIVGGNFFPAMHAVANSGEEALSIGLFDQERLIQPVLNPDAPAFAEFHVLGRASSEPDGWIAPAGFRLQPGGSAKLVASSTDSGFDLFHIGLAASILALDVSVVVGYAGSGDELAAIERGEIDVATFSLSTLERASSGSVLQPLFMVTDGPVDRFPQLPYLAGPGGLADQATRELDPQARSRALALADALVILSGSDRMLVASRRLSPQLAQCLEREIENLLFSEEFARRATAIGRSTAPLNGADSLADLNNIKSVADRYSSLYADIVEQLRR